ncbi:MAG: GTPase, partial [Actinomycetota bacterium]
EDRLFSTLDATVRRLPLPAGREVLISDTVGFVRDLPHTLVEAFRSTLEEAVDTDLLLHVVDAAADDPERQLTAVRATLLEIGAHELPELLVINKIDAAPPVVVERLLAFHPGAVTVSATTGLGIDGLLEAIETRLAPLWADLDVTIPFDRGDLVSLAHRVGEIISEEHGPEGTRLKARVPARHAAAFRAL